MKSRGMAERAAGRSAFETGREDALLGELASVYRDADALFEGWSCDNSTECCRFGLTGRQPYVTAIELLALERALAQRGKATASPIAAARREVRLPIAGGRTPRDEGRCPLLEDTGRCAAYAARPLGCRTFYCDRATKGARVPHARVVELVRRVQALGLALDASGDQGQPLTSALRRARRPRRR